MERNRKEFADDPVFSGAERNADEPDTLQAVTANIKQHYSYFTQLALSCAEGDILKADWLMNKGVYEFFWIAIQKYRYNESIKPKK